MLIQFYTKTTKVIYAGQVEEKKAFTYKVKVKRRHCETSHFAFSDKHYMSQKEREDSVAKLPRPIASGGTARTA